ncbi:MAG: CHAT domain-containing protein [Candidatus Hodarchaeota archaeon]
MMIAKNLRIFRRNLFLPIFLLGCMPFLFSDFVLTKNTDAQSGYKSAYNSGVMFLRKGDFQNAIMEFKKSLRLAEEESEAEGGILSSMRLGLIYWNIGQLDLSAEFYEKARFEAAKLKLREFEEECQHSIDIYEQYSKGKEFRLSGQHKLSIESFQNAITLAKKIQSIAHEAKCLRQMSITYWEMDDLNKFYELNEEALELAKRLNHKKEEGRCLNNIGVFYRRIGNYSKSLSSYDKALKIARELRIQREESAILSNIANIYKNVGQCSKSLSYLLDALRIDKKHGDKIIIAIDLINIGETYRIRGLLTNEKSDFKRALNKFNECLELIEMMPAENTKVISVKVKLLNNIGSVLLHLEEFDTAFQFFEDAYKIANQILDFESISMILSNMGYVLLENENYMQALNYYLKSIRIAERKKVSHVLWEAYYGIGRCYESLKSFPEAVEYLQKSIKEIEDIRIFIFSDILKTGFVKDKFHVYESLIELFFLFERASLPNDKKKKIFNIIEKAKARAFLEVLGESWFNGQEELGKKSGKEKKEISQESHLKIQSGRTCVENMIIAEPCQLEQVQRELLDKKTALIEFFLGRKQSFMFLIEKDDFDLFLLPPRDKISNSIKGFLKELSDQPMGKFRGSLAAKRLFHQLLGPLRKNLNDSIENLIIIPDGLLYYLPFEALIMEPENKSSEDKFLIEDFKISYAPSSSSLLFLKNRQIKNRPAKSLLAIGNPKYGIGEKSRNNGKISSRIFQEIYEDQGFDFSPLPYTEREVKEISRFFKRGYKDIYLGMGAREDLIKSISLEDYQIIHFACHGLHDEMFPFRSGLVLSLNGNMKEDGFLLVREIYDLKLAADLIVLSACKTGKGELENIEGVLGLPRIFFYCGAKSVVSSLWEVSDKSTSKFMSHFYKHISLGKSKSQALRLAKIEMLKSKYCHPFYWASFVLYGDFSPVHIYN